MRQIARETARPIANSAHVGLLRIQNLPAWPVPPRRRHRRPQPHARTYCRKVAKTAVARPSGRACPPDSDIAPTAYEIRYSRGAADWIFRQAPGGCGQGYTTFGRPLAPHPHLAFRARQLSLTLLRFLWRKGGVVGGGAGMEGGRDRASYQPMRGSYTVSSSIRDIGARPISIL